MIMSARNEYYMPRLFGYATVPVPYQLAGRLELFDGAGFGALLNQPHVRCLVNHDDAKEVADVGGGSLLLKHDGFGVLAVISPPGTRYGMSLVDRVRSGEYGYMSMLSNRKSGGLASCIGMRVKIERPTTLHEVTISNGPANRGTALVVEDTWKSQCVATQGTDVRGLQEHLKRLRDRNWSGAGDIHAAQSAIRKIALFRLARLCAANRNSRDGVYTSVRAVDNPSLADLALACGMFA